MGSMDSYGVRGQYGSSQNDIFARRTFEPGNQVSAMLSANSPFQFDDPGDGSPPSFVRALVGG